MYSEVSVVINVYDIFVYKCQITTRSLADRYFSKTTQRTNSKSGIVVRFWTCDKNGFFFKCCVFCRLIVTFVVSSRCGGGPRVSSCLPDPSWLPVGHVFHAGACARRFDNERTNCPKRSLSMTIISRVHRVLVLATCNNNNSSEWQNDQTHAVGTRRHTRSMKQTLSLRRGGMGNRFARNNVTNP